MKDKILSMLGNGIPAVVVAASCGVTPGYISQLQADSDFAERLANLKVTSLTKQTDRDEKLDRLEDAAILKMEELLPYATKPMEVTRIFQTLNAAKRRGLNNQDVPVASLQVITLNMPMQVINNFKLTEKREVIEVNDRALVTMQGSSLLKIVEQRNKGVINATANLNTKDTADANNRATDNSIASALA